MSFPSDVIKHKVTETNNIDTTKYDLENPTSVMNGREYKIIPTSFAESDEDAAETHEAFGKCAAAYGGIGIGLIVMGCYYTYVTCKDPFSDRCDETMKNYAKILMFVGAPLTAIACCCYYMALRALFDIRN